jgi:hypothetical protein
MVATPACKCSLGPPTGHASAPSRARKEQKKRNLTPIRNFAALPYQLLQAIASEAKCGIQQSSPVRGTRQCTHAAGGYKAACHRQHGARGAINWNLTPVHATNSRQTPIHANSDPPIQTPIHHGSSSPVTCRAIRLPRLQMRASTQSPGVSQSPHGEVAHPGVASCRSTFD